MIVGPIDVSCAVMVRGDGRVLVAQRPMEKHHGGQWEFPGGKWEDGETSSSALLREIAEELQTSIILERELPVVQFDYPAMTIRLHPWICRLTGPDPVAIEHSELRWLLPGELRGLDWVAADLQVLAVLGWD